MAARAKGTVKSADKTTIKPAALKDGDKVAIVAPSSRPQGPHALERARLLCAALALNPVIGTNVLAMHGYMAGSDEARAEDLNRAIKDRSIRAIFCLSGGYGALRLLDLIDYDALARDPKIVLGCDDNTSLLAAINKNAGLVVFHGKNLEDMNTHEDLDDLRHCLSSTRPLAPLMPHKKFPAAFAYAPVRGQCQGIVAGGNLSSFFSLMGTRHQPIFKDRILVLEDRCERNDVLERWFTSMYLSGELAKVSGVAFGNFDSCGHRGSFNLLSLEDVFGERLKELQITSCFGLSLGQRGEGVRTVPLGVQSVLDTDRGALEFLEPALEKSS